MSYTPARVGVLLSGDTEVQVDVVSAAAAAMTTPVLVISQVPDFSHVRTIICNKYAEEKII
jgi:hypothetical protein